MWNGAPRQLCEPISPSPPSLPSPAALHVLRMVAADARTLPSVQAVLLLLHAAANGLGVVQIGRLKVALDPRLGSWRSMSILTAKATKELVSEQQISEVAC